MHGRSGATAERTKQTMGPSLQNARLLPIFSQAKSLIPQPPLREGVAAVFAFATPVFAIDAMRIAHMLSF
jgi:hypothetical protein